MTVSAYLFEIRQIQDYVFATGKLRDASGGSELIDAITRGGEKENSGLARTVLARLKSTDEPGPRFYRAAGGVLEFCWDSREKVTKFRSAFRLALAKHAPGLVYNDVVAEGAKDAEARKEARRTISDAGPTQGHHWPLGSPMIRPAPRSGGNPAAMVDWTNEEGRCVITREFADAPTLTARQFLKNGTNGLARKFLSSASDDALQWPILFRSEETEMQDTAFTSETNNGGVVFPFSEKVPPRIAILHADGNGMGALFAAAIENLEPKEVQQLSNALTDATRNAVQAAMDPVREAAVQNVIPARPILLGGDDVTLILRADLVAKFVENFVEAYEEKATAAVRKFLTTPGEGAWPKLTTKLGFVVTGPNQPFAHACRLAENLAKSARDPSKSRIAFFRVAGAEIPEDVGPLEERGVCDGNNTLWRSAHSLEDFKRLQNLAQLLEDENVGRSGLRKVPTALKFSRDEAQRLYDRALSVIEARDPSIKEQLVSLLKELGFEGFQSPQTDKEARWCPLLAAHDLSHILRSQRE